MTAWSVASWAFLPALLSSVVACTNKERGATSPPSAPEPTGQQFEQSDEDATARAASSEGSEASRATEPGDRDGGIDEPIPPDRELPGEVEVTGEEVQEFASCYLTLVHLAQRIQTRAGDGEPTESLNQEYEIGAREVFEESSLTEQRYLQIIRLSQNDLDLKERLEKAIHNLAAES